MASHRRDSSKSVGEYQLFEDKYTAPVSMILLILASASLIGMLVREAAEQQQVIRGAKLNLGAPAKILSYEEFQFLFPRREESNAKLTGFVNRRLMFNGNSLAIGLHNLASLSGKTTYFIVQSPFTADRTKQEQNDFMGQLKRENEANLPEVSQDGQVRGPTVETSGKFGLWFQRAIRNEKHFEVPNFPLDQQPDPTKITHIDSDLRNCTGEIKNQRNCGACYAFSWISLIEWHYCMQTVKKIDFSEQHIVDCGQKVQLEGCYAGHLPIAKKFSANFGLFLEEDYPYKGVEGKCPKKYEGDIRVKPIDFTRVKVDREEWEKILEEQPILMEVSLPTDIMSYNRGVHPGNNCNPDFGHGMLLVGHGRQEGVPYWLIRNSMGTKWGENGYLRLSRDAPMKECFRNGFVSKFKFSTVDEDQYLDLYDQIKFQPSVEPEQIVAVRKGVSKWLD